MTGIELDIDAPITYKQLSIRFIALVILMLVVFLPFLYPSFVLGFIWQHILFITFVAIAMLIMSLMSAMEIGGELAAISGTLAAMILIYFAGLAYLWVNGLFIGLVI